MPLAVEFALFYVLVTIAGIAYLIWVLYGPIKRFLCRHQTVRMYYHTVRRVVLDHDFYLINCFENKLGDESFHIDHIVIGDKYLYCIRDRYYDGALVVKEEDSGWLYYHGRHKKVINNPMAMNLLRVERLSLMSGIDTKLFVSIVLINDDCLITPHESIHQNSFLVSRRNLGALIEDIESRDVATLDPDTSAVAARDFAELNLHGKK